MSHNQQRSGNRNKNIPPTPQKNYKVKYPGIDDEFFSTPRKNGPYRPVELRDGEHYSVTPKPSEGKTRPKKLIKDPWTVKEFDALYQGMLRYRDEFQKWKKIKNDSDFSEALRLRSVVDLKDKARNERKARERKDRRLVGIFEVVSGHGGEGALHYLENEWQP